MGIDYSGGVLTALKILNRKLFVFIIAVIVSISAIIVSYGHQMSNSNSQDASSLTKYVSSSDPFEIEILYPKYTSPGRELSINVHITGRNDYVISALVLRIYSCNYEPKDTIVIELLNHEATMIYENSTKFTTPKNELSITYRFKLPEELRDWLALIIYIAPIKKGTPIIVHYTEPIVLTVKVEK